MKLILDALKWIFPEPKGDAKLILVVAIGCGFSYYFSMVRADDKIGVVSTAIETKTKEVKAIVMAKENEIKKEIQSQNTIVIQSLQNIAKSQQEIKDNLKDQDRKLWQLSREVRGRTN